MALLELNNLCKTYETGHFRKKRRVSAVRNVSLQINAGACVGLVGESGCGKTTLANLILGIEEPDSGEILFDGVALQKTRWTKALRRKLQLIDQNCEDALDPRQTVYEILAEPLRNFEPLSKQERDRCISSLLLTVGLSPNDGQKYPQQFSLGQLQRICIARSLAPNPMLLVMDEPLSSLDVSVQAQILNLLRDLKEQNQIAGLLISHDLEAVYYLADSLYVMYRGQIVEILHKIEDIETLAHPYSRRLMSSCQQTSLSDFQEILTTREDLNGCPYAAECANRRLECVHSQPLLQKLTHNHLVACHFPLMMDHL